MLISPLSTTNKHKNILNSFNCDKHNKSKVNNCSSDEISFMGDWGKLKVQEHISEITKQSVDPLIKEISERFAEINLAKLKDVFEGFGEIICSLMTDNNSLCQKVENSKKEVQALKQKNNDLEAENNDLEIENSRLKEQISELKNKFNNNSNSTNLENSGLKARIIEVADSHKPVSTTSIANEQPNKTVRMSKDEIYEKLKVIINEVLFLDEGVCTLESKLIQDLGADSLDGAEIIQKFECLYGFKIPLDDTRKLCTVGDVVNYIYDKQ